MGRKRAQFLNAFIIALLGMVICTFFTLVLLPHIPLLEFDGRKLTIGAGLGLALSFLGHLLLLRHYYKTGWLGGLAVEILAVIVFVVLTAVVAALLVIPISLF